MWNFWRRLIDDERGQGLVEYSLIILLVVIACVGALTTFGGALAGNISNSASTLFG